MTHGTTWGQQIIADELAKVEEAPMAVDVPLIDYSDIPPTGKPAPRWLRWVENAILFFAGGFVAVMVINVILIAG